MDLVAAVVADEQSLEVVQPREGALDDPADATEPGGPPPRLRTMMTAIARACAGAVGSTHDDDLHRAGPTLTVPLAGVDTLAFDADSIARACAGEGRFLAIGAVDREWQTRTQ